MTVHLNRLKHKGRYYPYVYGPSLRPVRMAIVCSEPKGFWKCSRGYGCCCCCSYLLSCRWLDYALIKLLSSSSYSWPIEIDHHSFCREDITSPDLSVSVCPSLFPRFLVYATCLQIYALRVQSVFNAADRLANSQRTHRSALRGHHCLRVPWGGSCIPGGAHWSLWVTLYPSL